MKNNNSFGKYARYSGLGFQMIATIGLFSWIGYELNQYFQLDKPIITAILALLGVCISIFAVIRSVTKNKSD